MRNLIIVSILLVSAVSLVMAAAVQAAEAEKTLILYYSRTGNTKACCEALAKAIGADIMEIKDLADRSGGWGFFTGAMSALFNMQTGIEPEHPNLTPYTRIIVAAPIWSGRLASAARTVIARNRLDGKKVAVFSTTNVLEKQTQLDKARALVENAGGGYRGHFQIAVTEKLDGTKTPKAMNRIVQEAVALVPDMQKGFAHP